MQQVKSPWVIESSSQRMHISSLLMGALGVLFIVLTFQHTGESKNYQAAYWLGVLLLFFAIGIFIFFEKTTLSIHNALQKIFIHKKSFWSERTYQISFQEIDSISVPGVGRRSSGIVTYHLLLNLKNGKQERTGYFSLDQSEVMSTAERLQNTVGCRLNAAPQLKSPHMLLIIISAVGAIITYVIWYRFTTGQVCRAMWFGTAPPIIMAMSFFTILRILRGMTYKL